METTQEQPQATQEQPQAAPEPFDKLTPRELEVARLLATGSINSEIADVLEISQKTVDTHRQHAMQKLGTRNNVALARLALRAGLTTLDGV